MLPPLRYETLKVSKREFRLLRIIPGPTDQVVRCVMSIESLDCAPSFNALSYAWKELQVFGPELANTLYTILVNDRPLEVGINLAQFLHQARELCWKNLYWIDAICINQNDLKERNYQVHLMRAIYQEANIVLVWLGPQLRESDLAMMYLQMLSARCEVHRLRTGRRVRDPLGLNWTPADIEWDEGDSLWLKDGFANGNHGTCWRAVVSLIGRSWWKRAWTVQETVLAKSITVLCGSISVDWICIDDLVQIFDVERYTLERLLLEHGIDIADEMIGNRLNNIISRLVLKRNSHGSLTPLQILAETRQYFASEFHDKLYGVLGLSPHFEKLVPRADYDLPHNEVYARFLLSIIEYDGTLDILCLAKNGGLQSWLPNLDTGFRDGMNSSLSPGKFVLSHFDASKGYRATPQLSKEYDVLKLTGFHIDSVDGTGRRYHSRYAPSWDDTAYGKCKNHTYSSDCEAFAALWRSMIAGPVSSYTYSSFNVQRFFTDIFVEKCCVAESSLQSTIDQDTPQQTDEADEEQYVCQYPDINDSDTWFPDWYKANRDFVYFNKTIKSWAYQFRLAEHGQQSFVLSEFQNARKIFEQNFRICHRGRKLITTANGRVGLASYKCELGDIICILMGGRMPVVLRPVDNHYIFLGESYIHGLMQGEAIEKMENGEYKLNWFAIH